MTKNFAMTMLAAAFLSGTAFLSVPSHAASAPVQGPAAPEAAPTFEVDPQGKRAHIDFALNLKPISDASLKFSHFANRKLLVFYFSAVCPHCQHAVPFVQTLADDLAKQGITAVAVAVKFNSEDDIRGFIRDYKVRMPVFQDVDPGIGTNYGTGSIPLLFLVGGNNEYIRYKSFDAEKTPAQIKAEVVNLAGK